jgi:hypothetical protein
MVHDAGIRAYLPRAGLPTREEIDAVRSGINR